MPHRQHDDLTAVQWLLAYWFAHWHLARMPSSTETDRLRRATWCRDYCNRFAGRWFVLAIVLLFLQNSPLGFLFVIGNVPVLLPLFLLTFCIAIGHLAWQLIAQKKAGPPEIDPPQDWDDDDRP